MCPDTSPSRATTLSPTDQYQHVHSTLSLTTSQDATYDVVFNLLIGFVVHVHAPLYSSNADIQVAWQLTALFTAENQLCLWQWKSNQLSIPAWHLRVHQWEEIIVFFLYQHQTWHATKAWLLSSTQQGRKRQKGRGGCTRQLPSEISGVVYYRI